MMEKTCNGHKKSSAFAISITALFMALNILMSSFGVPVPGGRCYLNDVIICTAAILLDEPKAAFMVGGSRRHWQPFAVLPWRTAKSFSKNAAGINFKNLQNFT